MASTELVRRVENATPKDNNNGAASKAKKCVKCTYIHRRIQTTCPADGKPCNACKKPGHFKMSTLCQGQPTQPVRYLSSEEDEPAHPARSHKVRCVTGQPKPLVANRAISPHCQPLRTCRQAVLKAMTQVESNHVSHHAHTQYALSPLTPTSTPQVTAKCT